MAGPVFDPTKPKKLKNILTGAETYDKLHVTAPKAFGCTHNVCMGSIMYQHLVGAEPRKPELVLTQAKDFLIEYYKSLKRLDSYAHEARWKQVQAEIAKTGSYELIETELVFGAKLAWRNAARCVGRIQWSKLQLFDCRTVSSTRGMFEAICNHIKYATNGGNLRSAITVFKKRTDGKHDYRVWNPQLLSYAGYQNPDGTYVGDPANAEFTSLCLKLGWTSKRTPFDLLPLVVSANGNDPEWYNFPKEIILEVPLIHPTYKWFGQLGLKWYALPAVSGMMFDCGGIQFPGTSFSGWYMSTEIGCRNLCDTNRRNMLEMLAKKMDLDTRNPSSLWKDKALVEINIAVLYSFQSKNITIVDHHTASESFVKHCENEQKLRNGCPADWLWIIPPMSPSTVQVYHQEMALYYLKPSFDYQIAAALTHVWKSKEHQLNLRVRTKKLTFRQVAKAIMFTARLFGNAMSRRVKATVLYATETGKSENYAQQLTNLLGHAFNVQMHCMEDYVISQLEHESLLFVVTSTFGNGDPPENGEAFAQELYAMKMNDEDTKIEEAKAAEEELARQQKSKSIVVSKIMQNSSPESGSFAQAKNMFQNLAQGQGMKRRSSQVFIRQRSREDSAPKRNVDRRVSLSITKQVVEPTIGPLANVKYAVFALGSTAYPNYCAFGKYVDNMLSDMGAEQLLEMADGDEICGQEQAYREWAPEVFKKACEAFCLEANQSLETASKAMKREELTEDMLRFEPMTATPMDKALEKYHNKKAKMCEAYGNPENLHEVTSDAERSTMLIKIKTTNVHYEPGDHVAIYPENRKELVEGILKRLTGLDDANKSYQLQMLTNSKSWENHGKFPAVSVRTLLTRFLDITTPPTRILLSFLARFCTVDKDKDTLKMLSDNAEVYEGWRSLKQSHLLEVLEEFKSCQPPVKVFLAQLSPLQPRFYSISSSPRKYEGEIHLTVAIVSYKSQDGDGPVHYGVCSNYLKDLKNKDKVYLYVRNAQSFHIPSNPSEPIMLVGPGTGIAPFRSFWQQWETIKADNKKAKTPRVWLLFGCRTKSMDLYAAEKKDMMSKGIISKEFLALSREKGTPKTYVQDICKKEADVIYSHIVKERGHIYVCGDATMAEDVYNALKKIISEREKKTDDEVEEFMLEMKDDNRYHEDIFGITLRTAETQKKTKESAVYRMSLKPKY